jgi:hypothetical protein
MNEDSALDYLQGGDFCLHHLLQTSSVAPTPQFAIHSCKDLYCVFLRYYAEESGREVQRFGGIYCTTSIFQPVKVMQCCLSIYLFVVGFISLVLVSVA